MTPYWSEYAFLGDGRALVWGEGEGGYFEARLNAEDSERLSNLIERLDRELKENIRALGGAAIV